MADVAGALTVTLRSVMLVNHHSSSRARYCAVMSRSTMPLYALVSLSVTGPGTAPSATVDPLNEDTGQMQKLVEVTNASSAV